MDIDGFHRSQDLDVQQTVASYDVLWLDFAACAARVEADFQQNAQLTLTQNMLWTAPHPMCDNNPPHTRPSAPPHLIDINLTQLPKSSATRDSRESLESDPGIPGIPGI